MASDEAPATKRSKITRDGRLDGKVVFVTAAAQGIGRASALVSVKTHYDKEKRSGQTLNLFLVKSSLPLYALIVMYAAVNHVISPSNIHHYCRHVLGRELR